MAIVDYSLALDLLFYFFFNFLCIFIAGGANYSTPVDLGLARGTIPDSDITASSVLNSDSHPYYARLGNHKAWIPYDNHPWIQVNLQKVTNITAIATQGFQSDRIPSSYVTWYYLSYGDDGNAWVNYTIQGVKVK